MSLQGQSEKNLKNKVKLEEIEEGAERTLEKVSIQPEISVSHHLEPSSCIHLDMCDSVKAEKNMLVYC
jgi:hypothetical protein